MTHRYGRYGNKAWLRWRKKRFRRTSLTLAPQVAVLHVPLEFLHEIRRVTILMADGTEKSVEIQTDPLPSPTVDADSEKHGIALPEQIQSPQDKFYTVAKETARDLAERTFRNTIDPYSAKLDVQEARRLAQFLYYGNDHLQPQWRLSEAQEHFLREFKIGYQERLYQLSTEYGAPAEETQKLLIFARTDKIADESAPTAHADERTFARTYISLFSHVSLCQEEISEEVLSDVRKRRGLYQKFYDEFEPAKEED